MYKQFEKSAVFEFSGFKRILFLLFMAVSNIKNSKYG